MTALQQLKEYVDKDLKLLGYEHEIIIAKINSLLEIEKQQIIGAYESGAFENYQVYKGKDYYKQTYEQ